MAKLIADTNVWYEIGQGTRDAAVLKAGGNTLVAIPTSVLEIASPRSSEKADTWPKRRRAANAVLRSADEIADDTENHLAALWGLDRSDAGMLWHDICEITAQSVSRASAEKGIEDRVKHVRKSLNVSVIQGWREHHWKQFADDVENAIEQHVPGYKAARAAGKYKKLPKDKWEEFGTAIRSEEVRSFFIKCTFFRAMRASDPECRSPTPEEYARAEPLVAPYVRAYTEYIYGCATTFAPQPNDFGDCECFMYLQDGNLLVTREKRWRGIARRVCPCHYFGD